MVSSEILFISRIIAVELWKVTIFWKQSFFLGLHDPTILFVYNSKILLNLQPSWRSFDGYKHVVDVEYCPPASCEGPHYPLEAAKAKEAAQNAPSTQRTLECHESMEGNSTKRAVLFVAMNLDDTISLYYTWILLIFLNRGNDKWLATVGVEKSWC